MRDRLSSPLTELQALDAMLPFDEQGTTFRLTPEETSLDFDVPVVPPVLLWEDLPLPSDLRIDSDDDTDDQGETLDVDSPDEWIDHPAEAFDEDQEDQNDWLLDTLSEAYISEDENADAILSDPRSPNHETVAQNSVLDSPPPSTQSDTILVPFLSTLADLLLTTLEYRHLTVAREASILHRGLGVDCSRYCSADKI